MSEEREIYEVVGDKVSDRAPDNCHQVRLSAAGAVGAGGKFEVTAITAGQANGWEFPEGALLESLPLWDGVTCFVDHGGWFEMGRSVKDLGGVFHDPTWNAEQKGIRLTLRTLGPAGALVDALGREMLADPKCPPVGFSADIVFTAKNKTVDKVLRILSLDLVFRPARGGAFERALNSENGKKEAVYMDEVQTNQADTLANQMSKDVEAMRALLGQQVERDKLAAEAAAAREIRLQMCGYLLESGLAAAKLPAAMADFVRKQYQGRIFEATELNDSIDQARKLVSELNGPGVVQGPGRISAMFNTEDKLQAAVDDLMGAKREHGAESLKVERLSGIKELYLMLTGDREMFGGYYPDRAMLATTANFTGLVKNALNKMVAAEWSQLGAAGYDWWERIVKVEHFDTLNTVTGIIVGAVGSLPSISEGAEYTELKIGDSPETASFTKYGGYIPMTLELIDRDETRKLRQYPRELAKAALRNISGLVAAVFTANSAVGPTLADGGALFNATAVTTAGGHANLLTTALGTTAWEAVKQAMYKQPLLIANETGYYGTGSRQALKPRYVLVPIELELTARKILYGDWENATNIHADNMQKQTFGDVVVVPEWTDATDWAAVADPAISPAIVVCERFGIKPEIFLAGDEQSPAVFMNDEHRLKVRHYVAVMVVDFRPLHKENV